MAYYKQSEETQQFPNLLGRYEGHVVIWDEDIPGSIRLADDGEDFIGIITRSQDHYCSVSRGPYVCGKNGTLNVIPSGSHLVGAVRNGIGGYVRQSFSLEHYAFGITEDTTATTLSSTRSSSSEKWSVHTRDVKSFTGDGHIHIATKSSEGIIIGHDGLYELSPQVDISIRSRVDNILSLLVLVDDSNGNNRHTFYLDNAILPNTNVPFDITLTGLTPPVELYENDRVYMRFLWQAAASAGSATYTASFQIQEHIGIPMFFEVDTIHVLDGVHGTVIHDRSQNLSADIEPECAVDIYMW